MTVSCSERPRRVGAVIAALSCAILVAHSDLHAQQLRYTLTPTAQWVRWDDGLGIDDAFLYGGRAGFSFGEYIELQGYYLNRGRINAHWDRIGLDVVDTSQKSLDIQNYGADIVINLSPTQLKPFIRAGGSLLRFKPADGDATRQIALRYGGGIRLGNPGQLQLQLYAEDLLFRIDRHRLAGVPIVTPDPDADKLRHNLTYGAGLSVPLGGAVSGNDRPSAGVGGLSIPVDLFAGVMNFDDEMDLDGQNLVGVRTGLDFGPMVGLRGYYWRGVTDGFDRAQGIQSWGGEAQFRLNSGSGLTPYLIAGAGQLDFRDDFNPADSGAAAVNPVDRTMLILGGGVTLQMSDRLRLNVAARDHLFNGEGNVEDASRADDLTSNWMFSAGLSFNLGGRTDGAREAPEPVTVARVDTVVVDRETGEARAREARAADDRTDETKARGEGYVSGRTIQLPVPSEGELYVRYGPTRDSTARMGASAASGTDTETRTAIRDILREELARAGQAQDTTAAARELSEQRLLDRIDSAVTARIDASRGVVSRGVAPGAQGQGQGQGAMSELERQRLLADIQAIVRDQVRETMAREDALRPRQAAPSVQQPYYEPPRPREERRVHPRSFSAYTGMNVNKGTQFVLGGRLDLGPINSVAIVPEFAIGLGNGTTTLVGANAQYRFDPVVIGGIGDVGFYGQLGAAAFVGTLDGDRQLRLMLNPGYGAELTLDNELTRSVGTSRLFVEHQGLQFFKRNRFLVGLRWLY